MKICIHNSIYLLISLHNFCLATKYEISGGNMVFKSVPLLTEYYNSIRLQLVDFENKKYTNLPLITTEMSTTNTTPLKLTTVLTFNTSSIIGKQFNTTNINLANGTTKFLPMSTTLKAGSTGIPTRPAFNSTSMKPLTSSVKSTNVPSTAKNPTTTKTSSTVYTKSQTTTTSKPKIVDTQSASINTSTDLPEYIQKIIQNYFNQISGNNNNNPKASNEVSSTTLKTTKEPVDKNFRVNIELDDIV